MARSWRGSRAAASTAATSRRSSAPRSAGPCTTTQRLDAGRAHGIAGWRAAGDVPAADRRLAGRARPARRPRQRSRPVGGLARCGVLGRDPAGHGGPRAAAPHRHRPRMVGRPLAGRCAPTSPAPIAELAASQPPVVAVASPGFTPRKLTTVIIDSFVDQTARLLLAGAGWHAPITDTRRVTCACRACSDPRPQRAGRRVPRRPRARPRRSTIWRPSSIRPSAAPRASRSCGPGLRLASARRPTGRLAAVARSWSTPTIAGDGARQPTSPSAAPPALHLAGEQRYLPMLGGVHRHRAGRHRDARPVAVGLARRSEVRGRSRRCSSHARGGRRAGGCRHRAADTGTSDASHGDDQGRRPAEGRSRARAGSAPRRSSTGRSSSTTRPSTRRCSNAPRHRAPA